MRASRASLSHALAALALRSKRKSATVETEALLFLSKLVGVGGLAALLSWRLNAAPTTRRILLRRSLVTGKERYTCDGSLIPPTRGWLHGFLAVGHAARSIQIRSPFHAFLTLQYGASFLLHNAPFVESKHEKLCEQVDCYAIAGHISMLSLLGMPAPPNRFWKLLNGAALMQAVATGVCAKNGIDAWAYKASLVPILCTGIATWHAGSKFFKSGTPHIALLYIVAFAIYAIGKKAKHGHGSEETAYHYLHDWFHAIQAVATLSTLRQAGKL